ncbi:uncharacterized protein VNE69_06080 [Vairimorpha necatrix]|uniref:Uncharacterized protein n=1 Tax=Vairimorpha necatrix TaxID=6039 RepID=A0AAX4JCT1_9MICR
MRNRNLIFFGIFVAGFIAHLCLLLYLNDIKLGEIYSIYTDKEQNGQLEDQAKLKQDRDVSYSDDTQLVNVMNQYMKMHRIRKNDKKLQYSITNDLITVFCTNEDDDLPFMINLLSQYHKTGMFFLPQNNLMSNIINRSCIPQEDFIQPLFKMSYVRFYNLICTFLYVQKKFIQLEYICTPIFEYDKTESNEVDSKYKLPNNINQIIKWIDIMYYPMGIDKIYMNRGDEKVKEKFLKNEILNEMNRELLILDRRFYVKLSVLDYLIATYSQCDYIFPN